MDKSASRSACSRKLVVLDIDFEPVPPAIYPKELIERKIIDRFARVTGSLCTHRIEFEVAPNARYRCKKRALNFLLTPTTNPPPPKLSGKPPHWGDWEGRRTSTELLRMSNRDCGYRWSP
jgi:hypothetical protein